MHYKNQMEKHFLNLFVILFFVLPFSTDLKSQEIVDDKKYKVYTDVLSQIQTEEAIRLYEIGYNKDTVDFKPVIIKKKTKYYTNKIGLFFHNNIKEGKSAFHESMYLDCEQKFFMNIENNKIVSLDTQQVYLQCRFDTLPGFEKRILNKFHFNSKVKLKKESKNKILGVFNRNWTLYWKIFHLKHPKCFGIFELSDIVFSNDNKFAILYIGYQRHGLVGWGGIYYLEKVDGYWRIKKTMGIWES